MSENEKEDNKDFEFIKEQVIEKKHKKLKKILGPLCMMVVMAVLFGLIAAVTFCLAEPGLFKFLHKDENNNTPICFPSNSPENPDSSQAAVTPTQEAQNNPGTGQQEPTPSPASQQPQKIIVEKELNADVEDYLKMYDDIKQVVYETGKSIVTVSSISRVKDWYGNHVDLETDTSGVVIYKNAVDLLVLVSLDRVKGSNSIRLKLSDNSYVDAKLLDYETDLNLAVISVLLTDIPTAFKENIVAANLGESYGLTAGSPIIALGNPNGHTNSVEIGVITSKGSTIGITDNRLELFNTDIQDNDNSDGIIVNLKGDVIGLITRTLKEGANEKLSTAIGISRVKPIIAKMANKEPRSYFGIKSEDLTEAAKDEHKVENGIYVDEVLANSPAFEAGMKNGDIILQVDDENVVNTYDFYNNIASRKPEETIRVTIKRTSSSSEKEIELEVTLGTRK